MPRDDEDDDRPRRRRRYDDDDEDDAPRSRRRRDNDDDDEDDRPRRRRPTGTNTVAAASLVLGILSFCLSAVAGIPAVICGILGMAKAGRVGTGQGMAVAGLVLGLAGSVLSGVGIYYFSKGFRAGFDQGWANAQSRQDADSLKRIGLALHNYHDANARFPAAADTRPGGGPPIRSWRTDILPFVNEDGLYRRTVRAVPWDDPQNKPVTDTPVAAYWPPDQPGTNLTRYRVFVGPNTPFPKDGHQPRIHDFMDGTSNTFLVAEGQDVGPWAEPRDLVVTPQAIPALGKPTADRFVVVMADGSTRVVRKTVDPKVLRLLIDPQDGNVLPMGWEN